MDVASPLTARTAGRTTLGFGQFTLFTAARKFMLATQVTNGWQPDAGCRDSHHPSVPGQGHPSP